MARSSAMCGTGPPRIHHRVLAARGGGPQCLQGGRDARVVTAGGLRPTRAWRERGVDRGWEAALEGWRPRGAVHGPGKFVPALGVALALGGGCLADVAILRAQPGLFGPVACDPVVSRLVARLA